jgi:hypothetical protein
LKLRASQINPHGDACYVSPTPRRGRVASLAWSVSRQEIARIRYAQVLAGFTLTLRLSLRGAARVWEQSHRVLSPTRYVRLLAGLMSTGRSARISATISRIPAASSANRHRASQLRPASAVGACAFAEGDRIANRTLPPPSSPRRRAREFPYRFPSQILIKAADEPHPYA